MSALMCLFKIYVFVVVVVVPLHNQPLSWREKVFVNLFIIIISTKIIIIIITKRSIWSKQISIKLGWK